MQQDKFYKILNVSAMSDEAELEQFGKIVDEFPYFQAAQVVYLKSLKKLAIPEYDKKLAKVAVSVNDRKKLYQFLNAEIKVEEEPDEILVENVGEGAFYLEDDSGESKNSLIDKFLAASPGVIKRKEGDSDEFSEVGNEFLRKSIQEDDEIVTETLANIYFQQKKYDKALHAFQKLSLKYPEKSVYFASRIKEIEDLKNI